MLPAHVGTNVRRVFGPVRAIRATESGQLPAGVLQMVLQIVPPVEGSAALGAEVFATGLRRVSRATARSVPAVDPIGQFPCKIQRSLGLFSP